MTATRLRHVSMSNKAKWMRFATEAELDDLTELLLTAHRHSKELVTRRQLIRDRCYARARRMANKEG